mmetsp:Transcript_148491/g.269925  ORF Transcript_148491/g.269925 Transcript_148491/m.269925 type:complete len:211 (+) Transcript_148491:46-678(+)
MCWLSTKRNRHRCRNSEHPGGGGGGGGSSLWYGYEAASRIAFDVPALWVPNVKPEHFGRCSLQVGYWPGSEAVHTAREGQQPSCKLCADPLARATSFIQGKSTLFLMIIRYLLDEPAMCNNAPKEWYDHLHVEGLTLDAIRPCLDGNRIDRKTRWVWTFDPEATQWPAMKYNPEIVLLDNAHGWLESFRKHDSLRCIVIDIGDNRHVHRI